MKEIIDKLMAIEKETSIEKGAYILFAIFLREDSFNKWDILVSANWISNNKEIALKYLSEKIQLALTKNEFLLISRIVIIESSNPELQKVQQTISIEHGSVEIKDSNFFEVQIRHGFFVTSKKNQAA